MTLSLPLKFKAGRVDFKEETGIYTPSPIKGQIVLKPSEEGKGFYSFTWSPRENTVSGVESEELLVIAGDVAWRRVKSCTGGRVYMLFFLSSGAKNMYWMQDINDDEDNPSKETEKDKEIFDKINGLLQSEAREDKEEEDEE
ncbi:DEKNAAC100610 [Brettanomyces naardenensis]|uniref:DEKNAAC100610 n=1 Tax=Brettanomyces naardenensis TaxID=13370 RepID=A0A448YG97_BRENA|nr:DEKNAAC100610 [Brettanomyces naardenensis]